MTIPRIALRDLAIRSPLRMALIALSGLAAALFIALAPLADILPRPDASFLEDDASYGLAGTRGDSVCALAVIGRGSAWAVHHGHLALAAGTKAAFQRPPGAPVGYAVVRCVAISDVPFLPTAFVRNGDAGWMPVRRAAGWTMRAALLGALVLVAGAALLAGEPSPRWSPARAFLAVWATAATLAGAAGAAGWIASDLVPAIVLAAGLGDGLAPPAALAAGVAALPAPLLLLLAGLPTALAVAALSALLPGRPSCRSASR